MKKLLATLITATMAFVTAAPVFATEVINCQFTDKSLCQTESLSPTTDGDGNA